MLNSYCSNSYNFIQKFQLMIVDKEVGWKSEVDESGGAHRRLEHINQF